MSESYTREEQYLSAIAGGTVPDLTPITRKEMFLAAAAGQNVTLPEPITREEMFLSKIQDGGGGDTSVEDGLIDGSLTEYTNNRVTKLRTRAFMNHTGITSASFPNVTSMGDNVFEGCAMLAEISAPNCATLGGSAFCNCVVLSSVELSQDLKTIPNYCFSGSGLTEFSHSTATSIGRHAFSGCSKLKSVSLPNATTDNGCLFFRCGNLETVNIPNISRVNESSFDSCVSLKSAVFIKAATVVGGAFNGCSSLEKLDFHSLNQIWQSFSNCSKFNILILRKNNVCALSSDGFNGTPFAVGGTGGTVYVPSALIEQYQQATNWSALFAAGTCNFVAIEGSEYE